MGRRYLAAVHEDGGLRLAPMILDEPDELGVAGVAGTADETTHRVDDPVFGILQGLCIEGLELRRHHVGDDLVHGRAHALIHD